MKIKLLDKVLEKVDLYINKEYEVERMETIVDDIYYIIINEKGEEYAIIDMLAEEV